MWFPGVLPCQVPKSLTFLSVIGRTTLRVFFTCCTFWCLVMNFERLTQTSFHVRCRHLYHLVKGTTEAHHMLSETDATSSCHATRLRWKHVQPPRPRLVASNECRLNLSRMLLVARLFGPVALCFKAHFVGLVVSHCLFCMSDALACQVRWRVNVNMAQRCGVLLCSEDAP